MEFEFSDKRLGYAFRIIGFFAFALFIVFMLWFRPSTDEINKSNLRDVSNLSFHGEIDSIYRDKQNHNTEMLILKHGEAMGFPGAWEQFIEVGDSLSKKQNELILKIR